MKTRVKLEELTTPLYGMRWKCMISASFSRGLLGHAQLIGPQSPAKQWCDRMVNHFKFHYESGVTFDKGSATEVNISYMVLFEDYDDAYMFFITWNN